MEYSQLKNKIHQEKLTQLIDEVGAFFAFGENQLQLALIKHNYKKEELVNVGMGLIMPKVNVKTYIEKSKELQKWFNNEIKKLDKNQIIRYELNNYECYYSGEIDEAMPILSEYGFTSEQVLKVLHNKKEKLLGKAFPELQKNVDGLMNLSIKKS